MMRGVPRARLTIRARITLGTVLVASAVAFVVGIAIDGNIARMSRFATVNLLYSDGASYSQQLQAGRTTQFDEPAYWQYVVVMRPDGSTAVDSFPHRLRRRLPALIEHDSPHVVRAGSLAYVTLSERIDVAGGTWHVVTAEDTRDEDALVEPFRPLIVVALSILVVLVGITAWVLTRLSLSPVSRLQRTATGLLAIDDHRLLPVGRVDDEISRLAGTLNDLVTRLRGATSRERQLESDASHELRTPVAVLRTRLELADRSENPGQRDRALHDATLDAVRLSRLLDSLLELSSIEAGISSEARATVAEVVAEAEDAVERASFRESDAEIALAADVEAVSREGARVRLGAEELGRVLDNLLGNALNAGGGRVRIRVEVGAGDGALSIRVVDDAGGLAPGLGDRALARFSRGGDASPGTGAGLGLPIVAALVARAGGDLALHDRPGDGLTVAILLPLEEHPTVGS